MFKSLGSLIKEIPTRHRTPRAIIALQARQAAKESLKVVCGDLPKEVIDSVKALSFNNGVLTLAASPLVSSELMTRSDGLVEEINRALGKKIVSRLRFRVG
jgi:hypothetical protein